MQYGPLEIQACGENNFTMKALGLLAFRKDLCNRFVQKLYGLDEFDGDVNILFFSRIGENFLREAIEHDRGGKATSGRLEGSINKAFGLPDGFRWHRGLRDRLTQPAKWREEHFEQMLVENGRAKDLDIRRRLKEIQECLNTEPDVVLQWGQELALIEIKVLSGVGKQQVDRQIRLGQLLSELLGWDKPRFFFIGPDYRGRPAHDGTTFFPWAAVSEWFADVPEITNYIQRFAFFYHGRWKSMVNANATAPGPTAYNIMVENPANHWTDALTSGPKPIAPPPKIPRPSPVEIPIPKPTLKPQNPPRPGSLIYGKRENFDYHFSHLGFRYFQRLFDACRRNGIAPINIWLGVMGEPYIRIRGGAHINPNWMAVNERNEYLTRGPSHEGGYNTNEMRCFTFEEIVSHPDWFGRF